jgi:hypothetical protein
MTTGLVSYDVEGQIYAKYSGRTVPTGKYAILYRTTISEKDYVNAFRMFLKSDFDKRVVTAAYEVTEPTGGLAGRQSKESRARKHSSSQARRNSRPGDPQGCGNRLETER